jgi:hypothetical protein
VLYVNVFKGHAVHSVLNFISNVNNFSSANLLQALLINLIYYGLLTNTICFVGRCCKSFYSNKMPTCWATGCHSGYKCATDDCWLSKQVSNQRCPVHNVKARCFIEKVGERISYDNFVKTAGNILIVLFCTIALRGWGTPL